MAAVATRSQGPPSNPTSIINSPIDAKRITAEESKRTASPKVANRDTMSKASPKKSVKRSPSRPATSLAPAAPAAATSTANAPSTSTSEQQTSSTIGKIASTTTAASNAATVIPQNNHDISTTRQSSLPPPLVPAVTEEPPADYFSGVHHNKYGEEPNPFEQSFSAPDGLQAGKALLPPASSITSPSPNLGTGSTFNWGINSLRSGPLSPAMLTGPSNVFDPSYRTGLTPNESGIRSGLTPGGGGSMFPVMTPGSSALLGFGTSGTTPGTMEFHKTALAAQAASNRNKFASMVPPIPKQEDIDTKMNGINHARQSSDPFAGGDANAAASGLYMLANAQQHQTESGFNGGNMPNSLAGMAQGIVMPGLSNNMGLGIEPQMAATSVKANNGNNIKGRQPSIVNNGLGNGRGVSEASDMTGNCDSMDDTANGRGAKGKAANKKGGAKATPNKRQADAQKGPAVKKQKQKSLSIDGMDDDDQDAMDQDDDADNDIGADGKKMTDDEKRKNFLERNRVAALKCRQRKKQWLANLQAKVEYYGAENDALNSQVANLRDEIIQLKTLLLAHKECPVNQSAAVRALTGVDGIGGMGQAGDYQMHHYGVQQSMAPPNRRFS